jgi:polar amino acid transport system substrate-binding protein
MRKLRLWIAALLFVTGIAGAASAQQKSVFDEVKSRGVLRAGVTTEVPFFGFIDEKGDHVGFDADIAAGIAQHLGVKLELVPVTSATRIPMLQQGRIDLIAATLSHYRSRDDVIDFSIGYFYSPQTLLVKKSSGIHSVADTAGKRIGATIGSGAVKLYKEIQPKATIQTFEGWPETFLALAQGTVDAAATDLTILASLRASAPDPQDYEVLTNKEAVWGGGEYGIGVRENDSKWRDQVNYALQDMWLDGAWDRIFDKWVGAQSKLKLAKEQLGFAMTTWAK